MKGNRMILSQITCVLMCMTGLALSLTPKKSLDVPNYLQVILASYKAPKGAPQTESQTQKVDASAVGQNMSPQLESLLLLQRDIYHAYNLTYQIKDPVGRILYRNEYGDGSGSLKGSMNFTKDNGKKVVISYSLKVEEHPASSPQPALEQMPEPSMRNSANGNQMTEESYSPKEQPQKISISRAPQTLKSTTMNNKGKITQQERIFFPRFNMRGDNGFDDLQTLPSEMVEEQVPAFDDDMTGPVSVFTIKPKARGYEQVWKRGQGLVVDREYELPDYDYRSAGVQQRAGFEDGEDQKPVYVYQTKPSVRVFELSRDMEGNYQVPEKYSSNVKQQRLEDDRNYQIPEKYTNNIKQQKLEDDRNYQIPEMYSNNIKQQRLEDNRNYQIPEMYSNNIKQQGLEDDRSYQVPENYNGNIKQQEQRGDESYYIPEKYSGNIKYQGLEDADGEEPLYTTHTKPAVHVMQLNSDGPDSQVFGGGYQEQYPTDYDGTESLYGDYRQARI